ncbi:hypothetical protein KX816_00390 [Sphingosinicellaceae bacterium]|nr:hypothetical protein KX816_00390 [Sphingosinicellaceae bacterium]
MDVAGIVKGGLDETGNKIGQIYYRNPPHYAIFRAADRVVVHYHDDPDKQEEQRRVLAPINPLRGQINGLIDGWRGPVGGRADEHPGIIARAHRWIAGDGDSPQRRAAAARYDRRVADALSLALENDVPSALLYLDGVKHDIEDERSARARRFYVATAAFASLFLLILAWVGLTWKNYEAEGNNLMLAAGAGALGAFFSVAIATRDRAPLSDLRLWDSGIDAVLRVIIGMIGAVVLIELFRTGLVSSIAFGADAAKLNPNNVSDLTRGSAGVAKDHYSPMLVAVIGFLAGFVERLVGNLLATVVVTADPPKVAAPLSSRSDDKDGKGGGNGGDARGAVAGATGSAPGAPPAATDADDHGGDCLSDAALDPSEETPDDALPPAAGGVAAPAN